MRLRRSTQERIDALHKEIDRLVAVEKRWWARASPMKGMRLQIRETQIECAARHPRDRANMVIATASFPT